MKPFLAIVTGAALVTGACTMANAEAQAKDVTYQCAGGQSITITYTGDNGDTAVFEDAGESIILEQVPSGSGALYRATDRNYTYELHTKGDTATVYSSPNKVMLRDCQAVN